ncbi:MAG: PD-(D/E)XK nuclease family protein [Candidatus Saccharimonadales bacterium]
MSYWKERSQPYKPGQTAPFKVSRSKIELFTQCPRCFWLDARLKIKRPNGPPFNINKLIDELFKKEFDVHRAAGTKHPLQEEFNIEAIPYKHDEINTWRENFIGVFTTHELTNLHVFGAVDDVWVNEQGELMVVDYKATSKDKQVTALGPVGGWQDSYRRQMEVYQWLLRAKGFKVSNTGYFVYATADTSKKDFKDVIEFRTSVFAYVGSDAWVEPTLVKMKQCMDSDTMPPVGKAAMGGDCDYCMYARSRTELTLSALQNNKK